MTTGKWLRFDGNTWIYYNLDELDEDYHEPNRREEFHIRFQTDAPDSLLWFNGNETQNVHVIIKVGHILLNILMIITPRHIRY